ncbi:MAG TPA: ATP-binding protein, partial [Verrucomicrobiae bacterium]|nr:ATP-binding protein [Verrucomicrobiae bacterium]
REVQVHAKVHGPILDIRVQDDGQGFKPEAYAEGRRNGLGNMRRRAAAIGGTLELETKPGQGTMVKVSVKLREPAPEPV